MIRRIAVLAIVSLVLLSVALPALAQGTFIANASRVNLRSGPGVGYGAITVLARGQQVTVIGQNSDRSWLQVQLWGGTNGWVNARYVSSGAPAPVTQPLGRANAVVNANFLNIRNGPGANFEIVGRLSQGIGVNLLGRNLDSSWVQIQVPGSISGWLSARYLTANVQVASLPVLSNTGITPTLPQPVSTSGQTGIITANGLNVRLGPGLGYRHFDRIGYGESVSLIGRDWSGAWLLIQKANGITGWVHGGFVYTTYPIQNLTVRA
jgi:N-acetylmuramoyl-L-alanine amidase